MCQRGRGGGERVFGIMDSAIEEGVDAPLDSFDPLGFIEFRDVSFSYEPGREVLRGISLIASPGQTTALVGATGAGKSTLVGLLLRLYDLPEGGDDILIDRRSIRNLSRITMRQSTAFEPQQIFLFNRTGR